MFSGNIFDDRPIKILLKYNVKPIGINTTTPVIKQFLNIKPNDFFFEFFAIYLKLEYTTNEIEIINNTNKILLFRFMVYYNTNVKLK